MREILFQNWHLQTPYYFTDLSKVIDSKGNVRQSKKLRDLIKKNQTRRASMSNVTIYCLKVNSAQFTKGNALLYNEYSGEITLEFAN